MRKNRDKNVNNEWYSLQAIRRIESGKEYIENTQNNGKGAGSMNPIRKRREAMDLSRRQMSKKTGIPETSITKWELGIRSPGIDSLIKLGEFFECDPMKLKKELDEWRANK